MTNTGELRLYIEKAMPGAAVTVRDMTGGGDHFEIEVVSTAFEGLTLLERHRKMHDVMSGPMEGAVHAVKFKTLTPAQKNQAR